MKAKEINGIIKVYSTLPKSFSNVAGGFDLLSDSELESYGSYDVHIPSYDSRIKDCGAIEWDASNDRYTYPISNKTWTESLSELKTKRISELKMRYKNLLSETDWYVTRKAEKGTAIPDAIEAERDDLRSTCDTKESEINAKTTKSQVQSYNI